MFQFIFENYFAIQKRVYIFAKTKHKVMTKTYNKDEQRVQLERLSDLSTEQKQALADGEQVSLNTLYNYIRGSVVVPALAEAFIEKGAKMLKSKNK